MDRLPAGGHGRHGVTAIAARANSKKPHAWRLVGQLSACAAAALTVAQQRRARGQWEVARCGLGEVAIGRQVRMNAQNAEVSFADGASREADDPRGWLIHDAKALRNSLARNSAAAPPCRPKRRMSRPPVPAAGVALRRLHDLHGHVALGITPAAWEEECPFDPFRLSYFGSVPYTVDMCEALTTQAYSQDALPSCTSCPILRLRRDCAQVAFAV